MQNINYQQKHHPRGTVLLVVLVLVFLLPLAAYTFADLMFAEVEATKFYEQEAESKAAAESGIEYVAAVLTDRTATTEIQLYNSSELFKDLAINPQEGSITNPMFSIVAHDIHDKTVTNKVRFGLYNESGKLNLNAIPNMQKNNFLTDEQARNFLMGLPNMTEDLADAILDWIDSDSIVRPLGAEDEAYADVLPKNSSLTSLDELLNIPTITPEMLYGEDANRNGILDDNENDGTATLPNDNADGVLDLGWSQYLTIVAKEKNLRVDGSERIDLNNNSLTTLYDALYTEFGQQIADFVIAYRINGPLIQSGSGSSTPTTGNATANSNIQSLATSLAQSMSGNSGNKGGSSGNNSGSSNTGNSGSNNSSGNSGGGRGSSSGGGNSNSGGGSTSGNNGSSGSSGNNSSGGSSGGNNSGGSSSGSGSSSSGGSSSITRGGMDLSKGGPNTIKSLYDLVDAQVLIEVNGVATTMISPITSNSGMLNEYVPLLEEATSIGTNEEIVGKVHILHASDQVLLGIPGMTQSIIDSIHTKALSIADGTNTTTSELDNTIGWLLGEGYVDTYTMQQMAPYLTARGDVFTVQVLGYSKDSGPVTRMEAMIDTTKSPPMMIYQRDLTPLGKGFDRGAWMNTEASQDAKTE